MFSRRVVRYVVWRHLVRLPRVTYLARKHHAKNQPIKRTGHLARHTTYWAIPDWWGRAQGLASSRDVVSARELYLKYPT